MSSCPRRRCCSSLSRPEQNSSSMAEKLSHASQRSLSPYCLRRMKLKSAGFFPS